MNGKFLGKSLGILLIIAALAPFSIAETMKSLPSLLALSAINSSFFFMVLESIEIPLTNQSFLNN